MWLNFERRPPSWVMHAASHKAVILCVCLGFAGATSAMARDGFMHGMGGLRGHGGAGIGQAGLETPAYVLITVSSISNADAFKSTMDNLVGAVATFNGRLVVDVDKPVSWEGRSAEHLVMIRFDTADQAQTWKNSDAFKSFDAALHQSSSSNMELVQGLPMPIDHGGRGGRGGRFDAKAFEPNVEDYNQLLNRKLHSICKGC
jgi:uncharacterized protein (DUF1330 family)